MTEGATITVDANTTADGFATGSNSGSTLWNDKKQTADTNKNTTVTVANEAVFVPKSTGVATVCRMIRWKTHLRYLVTRLTP